MVHAQQAEFKCPNGTKYRKEKTQPDIASKPNFPQFEEFCGKSKSNGLIIKHGHYLLLGPKDEKLEKGQFVNGKKDGKWRRWIPSQILEDTWRNGEYLGTVIIGTPSSYTIDFEACNPHEYGIPSVFGSTEYHTLGKKNGNCELRYWIEIEMGLDGERPSTSCSVPISVNKLVFGNGAYGINFSSIRKYCKPPKP